MKLILKTEAGYVVSIPVEIIAKNRAECYAHEFDGDVERSLNEGTMPLFNGSPYQVYHWFMYSMLWSDVEEHSKVIARPETSIEQALYDIEDYDVTL